MVSPLVSPLEPVSFLSSSASSLSPNRPSALVPRYPREYGTPNPYGSFLLCNGIGVAPSSSDESDELSWFPGMLCAAGGGDLPWSRGSRTVGGVFRSSSDESEELSLVWRIWCSTRGGGSDPALEELDSDSLRIANLELRKT